MPKLARIDQTTFYLILLASWTLTDETYALADPRCNLSEGYCLQAVLYSCAEEIYKAVGNPDTMQSSMEET